MITHTEMHDRFTLNGRNPVLAGHQVYGQHILPGLAYIDLLFRLLKAHGHDPLAATLRNLAIYRPLVINPDEEMQLDVAWTPTTEGAWHLVVEGELIQDGRPTGGKTRFSTAEMHLSAPAVFDEHIDIEAVRAQALRSVVLADIYANTRQYGLVHDDFMQARGTLHLVPEGAYVDCRLGDAALGSAAKLLFHPTLIDGTAIAIGGAAGVLGTEEEPRLVLPLIYEAFRAADFIQHDCIARVLNSTVQERNELRSVSVEFFNTQGRKVAQLTNLTARLVRDPSALRLDRDKPPLPAVRTASTALGPVNATGPESAESLLRRLLGERMGVPGDKIDGQISLLELGLDSAAFLEMVAVLEQRIGTSLPPTLLFEHTTLAALANHLAIEYADRFVPAQRTSSLLPPPPREVAPQAATMRPPAGLGREPIAIVGVSGRYPQSPTLEVFWEKLRSGADLIRSVPEERWPLDGFYCASKEEALKARRSYSRHGGFMDDIDCFDMPFFGLQPDAAAALGFKELLFLETVWTLLEEAGYTRETLQRQHDGRVGVFVGTMPGTHHYFGRSSHRNPAAPPLFLGGIAHRVSSFFDLNGPSLVIDTQSSSSMTALHMACESLQRGECKAAIVGGVALLYPELFEFFSMGRVVGSRPDSRSFSDGDGLLLAEGVGAVMVKPLSQAEADGDRVLAVIRATATSHAGRGPGELMPNLAAQVSLFTDVLARAEVDPRSISYVESACYGSPIGDPIEVAALTRAFAKSTPDRQFCALGSVKSNMGHAEAASGMSQLTKVLLQMQHRQLAPLLPTERLNPSLRMESSPFYLQTQLQEWKRPVLTVAGTQQELPRRAMLNSFGAGGAYVSVVIEEYSAAPPARARAARPVAVVLSAKDEARLMERAVRLREAIEASTDDDLDDIAYTLQVGREAMDVRLACVADSLDELKDKLDAYLNHKPADKLHVGDVRQHREAFGMFAGDEDANELLNRWLDKGKLNKLCEAWTRGLALDWARLHGDHRPRRVKLPTHAFVRTPYFSVLEQASWAQASSEGAA